MARTGIVMRSTGNSYTIRDSASGAAVESGIRGRLRLGGARTTNPVAVGDVVDWESDEGGRAFITKVHPRTNYIIRRASNLSKESHIIASNLDRAVLVVTLVRPEIRMEFVDRFLVTCEAYRVPAIIVVNKTDLLREHEELLDGFRDIYTGAGYRVIALSALTGEGVDELREALRDRTSLVSGNSGVGKSTLVKCLVPDAGVTVGDISAHHNKGRHTTTHSQMYALPGGGFLIDTPGIKGFGLIDIDPAELYQYYPEMMEYAKGCQYYNCTHVHEPGCAVLRAVEEGKIAESRYVSYLKTLEEDEKYRK